MQPVDMDELSDGEIVARYLDNKAPDHFADLFRRHRRRVYLVCYAILQSHSEAEDVTQETFLKAIREIENFRGGAFGAWLVTIARNDSLNRLKRKTRESAVTGRITAAIVSSPPPNRSPLQDVLSAIKELPVKQRQCIKLFYINGYSYQEVADLVGMPMNEVKSHLQNGKRRLRNLFAPNGATGGED